MGTPNSYSAFLNAVQTHDIGEVDELLSKSSEIGGVINTFFNKLMPACYILDYTKGKYIYTTPRMREFVEQPASHFLDGGVEFITKLWHRDDLKVYSEKVMAENLKFLHEKPIAEHSRYLFRCNYRGKTKGGGYKNVMQESIFIRSAENGLPLASIGFLHDISEFGLDGKIHHTITKISSDNQHSSVMKPVVQNTFFAQSQNELLSKREIEVLKYVCENLSSQEIADKLFISKHTVDNHRRNLLEKTNAKTSIGLVRYAAVNGYI